LNALPEQDGIPPVEDRLGERARVYGSERAILVGLVLPNTDQDSSLRELESLADTAGVPTLAHVTQSRLRPDPSYLVGKGKVAEVKAAAAELGADVVIFDRELTPGQARNLEEAIGTKVIDRTQLILDIFAQRAATKEARLQVELAQLRYLLPRLRGWGEALTRFGAGIGTRGPGETRLESDRQKIRHRIHAIESRLKKVEAERTLQRKRRTTGPLPQIVLVGYTNSGKSTLLNRLCGTDLLVEDKLFATLATVVRRGPLGEGRFGLFIDTVGFIRALPHHLVPAFAATLEAVREADLILHVIDLASPSPDEEYRAVLETLSEEVLTDGTPRPPILDVLNKVDLVDRSGGKVEAFPSAVAISAKDGRGVEGLLARLRAILYPCDATVSVCVPYASSGLVGRLAAQGRASVTGYSEEGMTIEATLSPEELRRLTEAGARVIS
jgi:GTP-binding protein HflX